MESYDQGGEGQDEAWLDGLVARVKGKSEAVAPGFKNKTRYTPYVSPGSQISHIATNKGNINRQCLYNELNIKDITLYNKQRKDTPFFRQKLQIHRDN